MKLNVILTVLISITFLAQAMEESKIKRQKIEDRSKKLKEMLLETPSLKLLTAWQIARENRTIKKDQVPEEILEFLNQLNNIIACNDRFQEEQKLFLNLLNDPEIDIEKHFTNVISKYLKKKFAHRFIDKYLFFNYMLFEILEVSEPAFTSRKLIYLVQLLLNNYININSEIQFNTKSFILRWTPLTSAARHGHKEIVKMLLDKGADVDMASGGGQTPLICAIQNNNRETVQMIISAGASINIQDKQGKTALIYAVEKWPDAANKSFDLRLLKLFLDHDADVNIQDKNGDTALIRSLKYANEEIAKQLIVHGANVNIQNKNGCTALMNAAFHTGFCGFLDNGHEQIVKLLLEAGADVTAQDNLGKTALMLAQEAGHKKTIQVLKEAEAKTN